MGGGEVRSILVVSLSNIGDVVMTFPVVDVLLRDFPGARLTVIVGPPAAPLFLGHPGIRTVVYDKGLSLGGRLRWMAALRAERFDLAVDLRNTAIPFLLGIRRRTSFFLRRIPEGPMVRQHLRRLGEVHPWEGTAPPRALHLDEEDEAFAVAALGRLPEEAFLLAVAPGAADRAKRWSAERFAEVIDRLRAHRDVVPVLLGASGERETGRLIRGRLAGPVADLVGRTTLRQAAAVLRRCAALLTNDSALMHMGSYLDLPVAAIFGPTDPGRYGPWGSRFVTLSRKESCPACTRGGGVHRCLEALTAVEVVESIEGLLRHRGDTAAGRFASKGWGDGG